MRRRTLLHVLASSLPVLPVARVRLAAQVRSFTPEATAVLRDVAATVLPTSLGSDKISLIVDRFLAWGRDYEEGVALAHGYGDPKLVKSGPSPVPDYVAQLAALDKAARARGGAFGTLPLESRRALLSDALENARVADLPGRPTGKHIVSDLMAFYFRSSEANDLAYRARIGRQVCRTLELTTRRPTPTARPKTQDPRPMPTHESDVCIIGGGISSAMLARKLANLRPGTTITIVEAGRSIFDFEKRAVYRDRAQVYGEHPWRNDYLDDQMAEGFISMTMAVGGLALHWGGACNRFSEEDLRLKSIYGLATDWPLEWTDLERYYVEAERALNVAGAPSAYAEDRRSAPYPQAAVPLSYNLQVLKRWAEQSGLRFDPLPLARNLSPFDGRGACCVYDTCDICPTGARYSPDFTFRQLVERNQIVLHDRTLVRRLTPHDGRATIAGAAGVRQDRPDETQEYRARLFVVASGYCWSPHLLLLSANPRYPNGLANRSGLVGRYMTGHAFVEARVAIDEQTWPGQHRVHSLISREYFRCPADKPFVRHDTRVWEDTTGREPRLRDAQGKLLLGDELFDDWRARTKGSSVRLRTYLDVHPSADSRLTLNPASKNRYGDPMPKIEHRFDEATAARLDANKQHVRDVFARLARASNGKVLNTFDGDYLDHPAGGCRMGTDPATSVCDSFGRTHDHDNLWVVGAPTLPTGGCTNGTLTFVALTLRSADKIAESLGRA